MIGQTLSATLHGAAAIPIRVEAHVGKGIPALITVGLPDSAVKESRVRVEAAIKSAGFTLPSRRVLVNLAPADVRKEGAALDLAIAMALLCGNEIVAQDKLEGLLFVGELALDAALRPVQAPVIYAKMCKEAGLGGLVVPAGNISEAALVKGVQVFGATSLTHVVAALRGEAEFLRPGPRNELPPGVANPGGFSPGCFSEVRGQAQAKRLLSIAAIGGHHVLLSGSPGVGKTMLCERFVALLPDLDEAAELEVLALHSLSRRDARPSPRPPLRAPHHTLSATALIGGGSNPQPGEVSLAHHGVLFLDEFSEFRPECVNVLRQPMESGKVVIARAQKRVEYPAAFQLIAATNPCPCGNYLHPTRRCRCSPPAIARYRTRLRGPVADRFDLSLAMAAPASLSSDDGATRETSREIQTRVVEARAFAAGLGRCGLNRLLAGGALRAACALAPSSERLLASAIEAFALSGRAVDRALRVARSIADLAGHASIDDAAMAEALQYRHDVSLGTEETTPATPF